jgi:hypothetical protein
VFVELDLETQDFSPIRSTFGAIGLVQYGSEPAQVPAGLIAAGRDLPAGVIGTRRPGRKALSSPPHKLRQLGEILPR